MSQRVTRSSAARLSTDSSTTQPSPTDTAQTDSPHVKASPPNKKRKAPTDTSPRTQPSRPRPKRPRANDTELEQASTPAERPKKGKKKGAASATMSSAGQSSGESGETSPQHVPKDVSKRKQNRKKTVRDGEFTSNTGGDEWAVAYQGLDPTSSQPGPTSRKSKKPHRKDQDVVMKDAEKEAELAEDPPEEAPPSKAEEGTSGNAGGDEENEPSSDRRFTEDELDAMERSDDPFGGGFGRLAGGSTLAGSLRALSGFMSGTHTRLRTILEQLRTKEDPSVQLIALQDLSELLLISNEDNLAGHFAPDQYVKELVSLMQPNEFTGEENPEMMLLACRCIANMMEAVPAATGSIVYGGAVPVLCQKLLEINFIDLAEQALTTLEKISVDFPTAIVREGGLTACLTYLDFFATSTQRTAVTTAANCCRSIPEDSFPTVRDVMPILLNVLNSSDQRVVEQASLCVSRIVESFKYQESKLEELISADLLKAIQRLLLPGSTNLIGPHIHTQFLKVLGFTARASPRLSVDMLKMNIVDTLYQIFTGVSPPSGTEDVALKIDKNVIMQSIIRAPRESIYETLNIICELLPTVSRDGPMFMDEMDFAGPPGTDSISLSTRTEDPKNEKRVELLKECPDEVRRFAIILFPTLMHAYTSTVNLNVRQKALTAQLEMMSNFDAAILEDALRGVTYASHLASILSQQENPSLVTYALQAAELLLKRLESIYRPQFYREGVMSEIQKIADRSLSVENVKPEDTETKKPAVDSPKHESEAETQAEEKQEEPEPAEVDVQGGGLERDENDEYEEDDDERIEHDDDDEDDGEGDDRSEVSSDPGPQRIKNPQDIATHRARKFLETHGKQESEDMKIKAAAVLNDLRHLAEDLKTCYSQGTARDGTELFARLAGYFDGDALESITSYELMESSIVEALLELFNHPDSEAAASARSDFLEIFMSSGSHTKIATGNAQSPATAFSVLVHKLQDLLSRAEHFDVITVHQNAFESNRSSGSSMLAKQLRLRLVADEDSGIPRTYRNIMVSIQAIATFKALDDYLRPRIREVGSRDPRREERITAAMQAYAAAMSGRSTRGGLPPGFPDLGSSLPTRESRAKPSKSEANPAHTKPELEDPHPGAVQPRRSSRKHSSQTSSSQPALAPETPAAPSAESENTQMPLEIADETQISGDDEDNEDEGENDDAETELDALVDDMEEGGLERDQRDPSAVSLEVASTGKVTARTEEGDQVGTPSSGTPTSSARERASASARLQLAREMLGSATPSSSRPMSYSSALQQTPQDWHLEFSVNSKPQSSDTTIYRACHFNHNQGDELSSRSIWSATHTIKFKKVQGPPPSEGSGLASSPEPSTLQESGMPPSLDKHPVTSNILRLMSTLHELNANLEDVLTEKKSNVVLKAEPLTQFVNTKLTAKLNRQLEEPLIVASNCLPSWAEDLARLYPFLFPFETRHLFLSSTSFGYSRSMQRWQNTQTDDSRRGSRHEPPLGRVQRQKVRISRSRILESAIKVMKLYGGSPSILEVEYFDEVGTGLGPTLEFYSTVSKEFSRKRTKLWRENESSGGDYAFGRRGLFPAPMSDAMTADENGEKVLDLFGVLGKFIARSMLDSRIIDVSFNPTFFRIGDGSATVTPSLGAVASVDRDLAKSLKMLKKYATAKQRIDDDSSISPEQKVSETNAITVSDAKIEDLGLDFTLPGYPHIELAPDGSNTNVTIDNVGDYIKAVIDFTLGKGVQRQVDAFRAGFSTVFPYSALRAFTPDELVMIFGRTQEDWSLETLMDSIKADHGYNLDSKSVKHLLQTMSELEPQSKRDFLQFTTGSPKLPIGGFKSLTPMFTVVCKPSEHPYTSDDYLPSVMTCANYLKMPDYSSLEVLKKRLGVAIKEGQGAFHLS
ncbi:hypothetical protein MBLNU230_g3748t1 [Neophaeotheca triangularis]